MLQIGGTKMMLLHMHEGWVKCVKFVDKNYMLAYSKLPKIDMVGGLAIARKQ